ncbi:hypothetical protein B5S28_g1783 [[Candida] boidinii]|nr:hypothetical protein B5S28_g1783 [[Candida] boidinii]OWB60494.1 hypothetical protein B5S29_g1368 [[Candida] boidinii]OWB71105.1 hypothetical protein B5S31_g788 [[Candida] boidinii]
MEYLNGRRSFIIYALASTILAGLAVYESLATRPNFYSAGIRLAKDVHLIIVGNWLIAMSIIVGKILQTIMFGELKLIEIEHIYERSWYTVTSLLMSIAMFRHENNLLVGTLVLGLLFMTVFHWILADRIEFLFQHAETLKDVLKSRCTYILIFFIWLDYTIIITCIDHSFIHSADVFVIFGLDFAMVFFDLLDSASKYIMNTIEIVYLNLNEDEEILEPKGIILKFLELIVSTLRVSAVGFVFVGLVYAYRIPVNFTGDLYVASTRLITQLKDIYFYFKAKRQLDNCLEQVTDDDLERDDVCIICRDDMSLDETVGKNHRTYPKKLHCGHILHFGCLKSWLERSHCCPTCRADVFKSDTNRFSANEGEGQQQPEQADQEVNVEEQQPQQNPEVNVQDDQPDIIPTNNNTTATGRSFEEIINRTRNTQHNNNNSTSTSNLHSSSSSSSNQRLPILEEANTNNAETIPTTTHQNESQSKSKSSNININGSNNNIIHNEITNNEFSIKLPRNALLPPEWSVLPLLRVNNNPNNENYSVNLTNITNTNTNNTNITNTNINLNNSNSSANSIPIFNNENNDTSVHTENNNIIHDTCNSENVKQSFSQPMYKVRLNKKSVAELRTVPNDINNSTTGIITASFKPTKTISISNPTPASVPQAHESSLSATTTSSNSNKRKSYFDLIREEAENKKKIKQLEDEVNELRNWMNNEKR